MKNILSFTVLTCYLRVAYGFSFWFLFICVGPEIAQGSNPLVTDAFGRTALYFVAANGYESLVEVFLDAGVALNRADNLGWTALDAAAMGGHINVVRFLLEQGAVVTQPEYGTGTRGLAARNGHTAIVELLDDYEDWCECVAATEEQAEVLPR